MKLAVVLMVTLAVAAYAQMEGKHQHVKLPRNMQFEELPVASSLTGNHEPQGPHSIPDQMERRGGGNKGGSPAPPPQPSGWGWGPPPPPPGWGWGGMGGGYGR